MYRKFYSYNDMPVIKTPPAPMPEKKCPAVQDKKKDGVGGILSNLENDDIILLVVFLLLIMDDCEDRLLLLALVFIFFSDFFIT